MSNYNRLCSVSCYLGMKEDLWAEESFVADIDGEGLLIDGVHALVLLDPLARLAVVLAKLLHDVRAHVRELLLRTFNAAQANISTTCNSHHNFASKKKFFHTNHTSYLVLT